MGYYSNNTVDVFRVYVKPKKSAEKKYGNRAEYTTLTPDEIKSWSKNFTIEKVSKLIPAGRYTKAEYDKFLINEGRSKKDHEQHLKSLQFLKQYNKNNKTNFKTIEALLDDKRKAKRDHQRREAERKAAQLKQRQEYKDGQEAILTLSAINLGISKGVYTQEILDKPDARKLITRAHHAQRTIITNLIDDIHKTPLLLRSQFKAQINSIKSQLHKEIDKL